MSRAALAEGRDRAGRWDPAAAAVLPIAPDGAVGVYVFNGTVTVRRFRVRPVSPAE